MSGEVRGGSSAEKAVAGPFSGLESDTTIPWWQVDLGPEAPTAAAAAVTARRLSQGPVTDEVERRISAIVGSRFAIATSSGSTALTLALMAAGARPGDTVLCPAYTWIATAPAAHVLGCKVELADIEAARPVMDVSRVKAASGDRCFAIPVHMNGHAVDVQALRQKGYIVIEDAAQALGSCRDGASLGTLGDLGCYSFSVSKIIGAGQGGLVVTDSDELAERARRARTHGVVDVFAPEVWESPGHNFRYNDVLAAILLTQIPLLEERLAHARALTQQYFEALVEIDAIDVVRHESSEQIGPYVEARVCSAQRDALVGFLSERGIGARRAFPSLDSAFYLRDSSSGLFENARAWSESVLYLPSGPGLTETEVEVVIGALLSWIRQ